MAEQELKYESNCVISQNTESTVVAHYERPAAAREDYYQTEAQLERRLIEQLQEQGYEYIDVKDEAGLIANLRCQLQKLNNYTFTDGEWKRFFDTEIASNNDDIAAKTETIQKDEVKTLRRDNGELRNIKLIDKTDIHANRTQVINQYVAKDGARPNRYDVTILINGLPLVHIELKRRGVALREAFNQINRYGRESFYAGAALFEYVQIFVVSNGTETKYYSNTTRDSHVREQQRSGQAKKRPKTSNSFEFTSYWADATNKVIGDLEDFTATFFSRHTLLNVLTRYCVFTEQRMLLAMRPYQIAATERLLRQVEIAHNQKQYGKLEAGGYVWHTTGSGKTLTSFKAAQLCTRLPYVDKVFFVVDRKDLDYQTMKEYDRFQKGAANGNTSTAELKRQIKEPTSKIIITTIQKLSCFVKGKENQGHEIYQKEVVIIFDECHRSQFGQMHADITKRFKRYYLFGFTGTPIFGENISASRGPIKTTEAAFGKRLHTYTIVDAIRDHNVLPFRIDYVSTIKEKESIETSPVWDIARDNALADHRRIGNIVKYILEHFNQQTKRSSTYSYSRLDNISEVVSDKRKQVEEIREKTTLSGFNSILATQDVASAKMYYAEFKQQMRNLPSDKQLRVATIFTYAANEDEDESPDSPEGLDKSSRDFLEGAIKDYNGMFATNYDTSAEKFPNYYKDISLRMKNREIDLLIVVNMFLTGFDATTLNTLWVDKNLRYHGLLQAFSRTNRILNSVKVAGNIVCFRNLDEATNKALALFGDRKANGIAILRKFEDYMYGYEDKDGKHVEGYVELVERLKKMIDPGLQPQGEQAQKDFIRLFGAILRMINLLSNFDQFAGRDPLSERDRQDYTSIYIDLRQIYYPKHPQDKVNINDDVVFEMELVKQVEVNIDYILFLVSKYHEGHCQDKEIRVRITKAIDSSPDLRDKKELIEQFVDSLTPQSNVEEDWHAYVEERKREEFATIVHEENLKEPKARQFIQRAFENGYVPEGGMELSGIMPPLNPFNPQDQMMQRLLRVVDRLKAFFAKFFPISGKEF